MVGVGWLAAVIIGGFAGWIASAVMKTGTGIIANIILGVVGAVVLNAILVAAMGYTYGGLDRPAHRRCDRGDHPHLRLPRGHEPQPDVKGDNDTGEESIRLGLPGLRRAWSPALARQAGRARRGEHDLERH